MRQLERAETSAALADEYGLLSEIIASLGTEELTTASACEGWTNKDLLFHLLLDAQRALVTFNTPGTGSPDKDFVTYWQGFIASDEGSRAHARFVRISAAAHQDPRQICTRWIGTAEAAVRSCMASDLSVVATQGHVLTIADFIATLVVEAAIHHLDLVQNLEAKPGPAESALTITTATLNGLLAAPRPSHWDDATYILKATGRRQLNERDRTALGDRAVAIPLFS